MMTVDLVDSICPGNLQVQDNEGRVVGCKSDCLVSSHPSDSA